MDSISSNAARVSLNTSNREQRRDIESYFGVTLFRLCVFGSRLLRAT